VGEGVGGDDHGGLQAGETVQSRREASSLVGILGEPGKGVEADLLDITFAGQPARPRFAETPVRPPRLKSPEATYMADLDRAAD
jgi:hypothetical protein